MIPSMSGEERNTYSPVTIGLFIACVLMSGAVAFTVGTQQNPSSQLAVGVMADLMCQSSRADARCPCGKGIDPRTGQCSQSVRGGGKIGCECYDITAGQVAASGKCATVGKCQADQAGGMMPMLPMLPMMMPMPKMPAPPEPPCTPTSASSSPWTGIVSMTPCPAESRLSEGFNNDVDAESATTSGDETASSTHATSTSEIRASLIRFLESVGIFQDSGTTTVEIDMGPGFIPLRIIVGRGDATELHPGLITILYEQASTSEETLGPRVRRFGQSTFMYAEPLNQSVALFSRTLSTLERMLDRMLRWIQQ